MATGGESVKIALLDSGANLRHPSLGHLNNLSERRYFVAKPEFLVPNPPVPPGNDDVQDASPLGVAHGTACLSVLAAASSGVGGVAPKAQYYVLKVAGADAVTRAKNITDALDLALRLDVDIIVCTMLPRRPHAPVSQGMIDDLSNRLQSQKVLLFSTLRNSDVLSDFSFKEYPTLIPGAIACGCPTKNLLNSWPSGTALPDSIDLLLPPVAVTVATFGGTQVMPCSSSFSTVAMAGLAANYLAFKRQSCGDAASRLSRSEVLSAIQENASDFSASEVLNASQLQVFK